MARPNLRVVEPIDAIISDMDRILKEWATMDQQADRIAWAIVALLIIGAAVRLGWAVWG